MNSYVTFTVAANGEYHDFGRYYTDIEDIGVAKSIYLELCEDKYILTRPSLGISYGADEEEYQIDIVSNGVMYIDIMLICQRKLILVNLRYNFIKKHKNCTAGQFLIC